MKRQLQVYWTVDGNESPFIIARGPLTGTMGFKFTTPADETPLQYMLNLGYQLVYVSLQGPGSAGSAVSMIFQAHSCQFTKVKAWAQRGPARFRRRAETVYNATDIGGSGGLGPYTVTLTNAQPTY